LTNHNSTKPIAVFDTGLGGLTVAAEIHRQLPHENLVFLADMARVPYASLSTTLIRRFSAECFDFLLGHDPKALVVACNTVSAVSLEETKERLTIPALGVIEPTAKAAFEATRNGRIGVIATNATVKRKAYDHSFEKLGAHIEVFSNGCPLLVPLVEEGWIEGEVPDKVVQHYLEPILAAGVDTLVLGCTHYEYFRPVLQRVMGEHVALINTPQVTAQELNRQLAERNELNHARSLGTIEIYSSDVNDTLERVAHDLFPDAWKDGRLSIHAAQIPPQTLLHALPHELQRN
jgi:glutamate racemase